MIADNGLGIITVKKEELLTSLRANLETHRTMFLEAQTGYREAVVKELDAMLADAKAGKSYRKIVQLDEPQDHTKDYRRIVKMLEMSVGDEIKITEVEFSHYVLDEWSWKGQFLSTSDRYSQRR